MAGKKPQGLEEAKYTKMLRVPARSLGIVGLTTADGAEHPDYDPRISLPINPEMLASIDKEGVHQVVHICLIDGQTSVIDGRQRVRTAWAALDAAKGKEEGHPAEYITCKLHRLDEAGRARFAIQANMHRQDDDPVTEAEKAKRLTEVFKVSDEDVCRDFGWSIGTLRNRRKLIDGALPKSVLDMVRSGKLLVSAALKLKGQGPAEALKAATELASTGTSKQGARTKAPTDKPERPKLRLLAKLATNDELSEDFRTALRWMLGELQTGSIKGLTAAIEATKTEKVKPVSRKTAAKGRKKKPTVRLPPKKGGTK